MLWELGSTDFACLPAFAFWALHFEAFPGGRGPATPAEPRSWARLLMRMLGTSFKLNSELEFYRSLKALRSLKGNQLIW